jgi:hypothetical protein
MSGSAQTNHDAQSESWGRFVADGDSTLSLSFQIYFRFGWIGDDKFIFRLPLDTYFKVPFRDEYVPWFVWQFSLVG